MKKLISALIGLGVIALVIVAIRFTRSAQTPRLLDAQERPEPLAAARTAATEMNLPTFAAWVRNAQAAPVITPAQLAEGQRLAEERRAVMLQLMRENPQRALEQSLKWHEWAALPAEIQALVEQPFSQTVEFSMTPDCRPVDARTTPWQTHRVQMNGEWLDAFVFGKRTHTGTKNGLPVQGIRLGNQVALWDRAVLPLNAAELAAAQNILPDGNERTRSWVTGQAINGVPKAALIGGKVHYFADADELQQVADVIAEAEAQPGPFNVVEAMAAATSEPGGTFNMKAFTVKAGMAKSAWTEGPKRVLLMRVDFTPASGNPYTPAVLQAEFLSASNTFREMSFNKTWLSNTMVSPLITLPNPQSYWETNSTGADGIMDYAKSRLASLGFNTNNYDIFVVSMPYMQRYESAAAFAQAGGQHHWVNGGPWGPGVATHETGHNYGYIHANYWRGHTGAGLVGHTNGVGGVLEHDEYGDQFEIMGDAYTSYPHGHFGMQAKALFNWIEPAEIVNVATSGVYRVRRFDHINARQLAGTKLALSGTNAFGDRFWIGYRRAPTNSIYSAALTGAYIIWGNEPHSHRIIDTTPLSVPHGTLNQEILDAPLQVGQSWADPSGTLRITTIDTGGASPNEYLDVAIDLNVVPPSYQLFTTSGATTRGLVGSYVNSSLRSRVAQEDWRSTAGVTISGARIDPAVDFSGNGWGVRASVGVTGGSDADWDEFSVQWDGWLQVNRTTRFALRSDDSSRMWIDLNNNGVFAGTGSEFINNNWGIGQSPTLSQFSVPVAPGLYRIRIQYEEGLFDNVCELVAVALEFDLFTDAALTTSGLTGSYVNSNLRGYSPQDDWRTSQTISGSRRDAYPLFIENSDWGSRASVGITGGADDNWDNYSVQWDGWIRVNVPTRLATMSDDSSRMWVDVNGNGAFATTAPEFINNHWGTTQGDVFGETSALINPGTYRIRIQYEAGTAANHLAMFGALEENTGPAGYTLYFDGVDDRFEIPNAGLSLPTNEITIEFWQRTYELKNQSTFCLSPEILTNRINGHVPWSDGRVYWDFGDFGGAGRLSYLPPSVIGTWQHFALVSSRAGNFQRIYRNGVLEASDSTSQSFFRYAAALRLGVDASGNYFKGELDEFRIWSVARTQSEIQNNMDCCMADHPSLWGYWRFDEGTGTTVADLSGNGRNGTIAGAQWVVSSIPKAATAAPEIAVFTGATTNAGSERVNNVGTHVFANTVVGSSSAAQTFTIKNVGTAALTGLAVIETGVNLNDFTVSAPSATLAPQATTTFTVTFTPTSAGVRSLAINVTSSDENESPFIINVSGTGTATVPEIAVFTGNTTNAAAERANNVGTFTFANTSVGGSVTSFFTIKNMGTADLTGLGLSESGANPGDFRPGGLSVSGLAPNATTTFWVAFDPTVAGTRTAVIQLASNDGNENPFLINVSGVGTSIAITQQPTNTGACVGGVASFSVRTASPGLSYQWQRRAAGTLTFSNISGATSTNYTTPPATGAQDGTGFRVIVSDGTASTTSSEALLSVIAITSPTVTYNFTGGNLGGGSIYGDASVSNNTLVLTPASAGKSGSFVLPMLAPGRRVQGFSAQFKLQIASGNGYADGFSFNWATDLPSGVFTNAEEGVGSGLRVGFDTFNNGGNDGPAIEVKWGTNVIASYLTANNFLPGTNDFADVGIQLRDDGTLDVTYRCVPIFVRLPIPGYTPLADARFGLGARTGGSYEVHAVDDLAIVLDLIVPTIEASVPGDLAIGTSPDFPSHEAPPMAIDNDVSTKYFNWVKFNSGLTITPTGNQPVRALTLISANDVPGRDPSSFLLEGSNDGTNFTRIASNAVSVFPTRRFIQSVPVANNNTFNHYRLLFPTVAGGGAADAMQIAEVELLYHEEITRTNDTVSIVLPPGASEVFGVGSLFDRQLEGSRKLEVAPINNADTIVNVTLAAGAKVLRGFELIGAADDYFFPERRPRRVTVSGSTNGTTYTEIATVTPPFPSSNWQLQEFSTAANNAPFLHYRITFGPPVAGDRLQVGELRLFGETEPAPEIAVFTGATTNAVSARTNNVGTNVFATTLVGSSSAAQTFTIKNVGNVNLTGLALSKVGANVGDFVLGSLGATTLAPQATTTFTLTFAPTNTGTRSAIVNIASNDGNENPFAIHVAGTAVAPEIAVFTGATTNAANERLDSVGTNGFPNANVGSSSAAQTFTVKNVGTGNLTGLGLAMAGANPGDFVVSSLGATTLAPQATTTFSVTFTPTATGVRAATVNLASNDGDENPFSINVSGAGTIESFALIDASIPGDAIVATSTNSPVGYGATSAIDNTATGKYLNFDKLNSGMTITPTGHRPVQALTLISAEDVPDRDPSSFVLEGSNDGTNFTRITSNSVPAFPARHFIQSVAFSNTNVFDHYRVVFPTVSNAVAANSMQIAEVELLHQPEITSTNDTISITLPPGAMDVRGVGSLFDRQLDDIRKLEVAPIPAGSNTIVNVTLGAGAKVLKGFELIGAADDFAFPQRRPSSVTVAGSIDGITYTNLTSVVPAAPTSNLQIQEFATSSNTTAFAHFRITFGPPVSGDRLQVGEMRLFGDAVTINPPMLSIRVGGNSVAVSWPNSPGYSLESKTSLSDTNWTLVGIAPVASNGVNTVTWPAITNASFFRLRK